MNRDDDEYDTMYLRSSYIYKYHNKEIAELSKPPITLRRKVHSVKIVN